MSSLIWTPAALSSERRAQESDCWRLVEAQHRVSTLKLTDTLGEQALLEDLLETTKPSLPPDARGLHYLMAAPFRYGAIYPYGSRFRRAGRTLGVLYGAEQPQTAAAEMAFYRLLFYAESPATPFPANAAEYTAFNAPLRTEAAIDLTAPPFASHREAWTRLTDYEPCQSLAEAAREVPIDVIRYESVRDPAHRANLAVLAPRAFISREPARFETWRVRVGAFGAQVIREFPTERIEFGRDAFSDDPRLSDMKWERG
ncbi:RES family NAD+ phosphorylase [Terrarubrum flagellatum]|uniref:RES family NAD+ phosphorylase n=1 Tax=Terrirubrum flagellatum TaxID=2895980 RepID=UPI0031456F9D